MLHLVLLKQAGSLSVDVCTLSGKRPLHGLVMECTTSAHILRCTQLTLLLMLHRERGAAGTDVGVAVDPEELEGLTDAERQQLLQVRSVLHANARAYYARTVLAVWTVLSLTMLTRSLRRPPSIEHDPEHQCR